MQGISKKRGMGSCSCGEVYLNRCKPRSCSACGNYLGGTFVKKQKAVPPSVVTVTDNLYSVKVSQTGPDFRCFVTASGGIKSCLHQNCLCKRNIASTSTQTLEDFKCPHIELVEGQEDASRCVHKLHEDGLADLPYSTNVKEEIRELMRTLGNNPPVVQVSNETYVVYGPPTASCTVGYCHVSVKKNFLCSSGDCKKFKTKTKQSSFKNKCIHYYMLHACVPALRASPNVAASSTAVSTDSSKSISKGRESTINILVAKSIPYEEEHTSKIIKIIQQHDQDNTWPTSFVPGLSSCGNCGGPVDDPKMRYGKTDSDVSYLLTFQHCLKPVKIYAQYCKDEKCKALNMAQPLEQGLLNICDKIMVSFDVLLHIRHCLAHGIPVGTIVMALMETFLLKTACKISSEEVDYLTTLLTNAFWAFESLTIRDDNSVICGICGIIPQYLNGDGNEKNCCSTRHIIYEDESEQNSEEGYTMDNTMYAVKRHLLEQLAYTRCSAPLSINYRAIGPIIAPALRGKQTFNTENEKQSIVKRMRLAKDVIEEGDYVLLTQLIMKGYFDPKLINSYDDKHIRDISSKCNINVTGKSKFQLQQQIIRLYDIVLSGESPCHGFTKADGQTGGYYLTVCRHGAIYTSKVMTLRESVRDPADQYLSLQYPPPVFINDTPCGLTRNIEARNPLIASELWGDNSACFETPCKDKMPTKKISVPELLPLEYKLGKTNLIPPDQLEEYQHPITRNKRRYILEDRFHATTNPHKSPLCSYHDIDLCAQSNAIKTSMAECENSIRKAKRLRSTCAQSIATHIFYNYLMDFYHNEKIVKKQKSMLAKGGYKVARSMYHRFEVSSTTD